MNRVVGRECSTTEITEEDIAAIMQAYPKLSSYGFGTFGQYHREYRGDLNMELHTSRDELLGSVDQCANVCNWLYAVAKSTRINRRHSSYSLKHYVERLYKPFYCYNGSFIVAAIHLGFDWVRDGMNAYFYFDQRSLDQLLITTN